MAVSSKIDQAWLRSIQCRQPAWPEKVPFGKANVKDKNRLLIFLLCFTSEKISCMWGPILSCYI